MDHKVTSQEVKIPTRDRKVPAAGEDPKAEAQAREVSGGAPADASAATDKWEKPE